jgi:hypothetical protein
MPDYNILREGDIIYVYSSPPETSPVGIVVDINKKVISLKTIKRESGDTKNGKVMQIELRKKPPITLLNKIDQKQFLTTPEIKRLKEVKQQLEEESEQILWD